MSQQTSTFTSKAIALALVLLLGSLCCYVSSQLPLLSAHENNMRRGNAGKVQLDDICCMPLAHTVNATMTKTSYNRNSNFFEEYFVSERHILDLPGGRYRLDLDTKRNKIPEVHTSILGFVSLSDMMTMEFTFDERSCQCKTFKGPSYIFHRSCVSGEFVKSKSSPISLGFTNSGSTSLPASLYTLSKAIGTDGELNAQQQWMDQTMVVQELFNANNGQADPECVIINWDISSFLGDRTSASLAANAVVPLSSNITRLTAFNFKHGVDVRDYDIPSHCRKC